MDKKINVLIFPAGEQNSIELHDALCSIVNVNVFGASSEGRERHGSYIFENYIPDLPLITSSDFIEKFNAVITQNNIDVIFPTHDTVCLFFAENTEKINAKMVGGNKDTALICRDKKKMYELFAGETFMPAIFDKITSYPVFIKPREGQGSVDAKLIRSEQDIPQSINFNDYVICEYLRGEEYTVDCLTDRNGRLLFVSPRSRERILAGISVAGTTEEVTDEIQYIAEIINKKLDFSGLWYFQIKKDLTGKFKLLEISARVAGTMCLSRARGVNLPLLSIYAILGYDIEVLPNGCNVKMDRALIARYKIDYQYDTVYFDFDDTLIVRGKVNLNAIRFLYQCQNLNKSVILLTKHSDDIEQSMNKYCINKNLFSEIIHIDENKRKSDFVKTEMTIFIDNAYSERKEVYEKCCIPVFDVDGIEVLLDWRS
jgi:predicted ATP-grasp superfamily ATP-dependent carboligase